ncbi:hypothetical protein SARC_15181 [Sphaeroforma arctica JP610]|uniref:Programmed cell death protein 10 dimerisation domain-containing protein n=1 Tax=Sphaeroforma arctica JP610 TaxID=667725 RepID=A0A0L0F695_9EUKA|nr:hypothetical protein SARC_15181 [Sphaeroforma arctica JP610]KNC72267.1 hypothetical protein SARC_15181 [Sphaeroforma arctica JP610]|eukprot:XP_014146169.1 hypothetical protein SARC_15181 [Sphaeroforma arctica JP610]
MAVKTKTDSPTEGAEPSKELVAVFEQLRAQNGASPQAVSAIKTLSDAFREAERLKPGFSESVYKLLCSKSSGGKKQ